MKTNYFLFLGFILLIIGCSAWKEKLNTTGSQDDAVLNVVTDFLNSSGLSKKDSVFSVQVRNISDDILGVSIIGSYKKWVPNPDTKVGSKMPYFPSRYVEKEGKLFYWSDSTHVLTDDLVKTFSKYNLIDSLNIGVTGMPDGIIDDSKKGVDYYICKGNFTKYKKVTTNKGIGYYDAPKLNCD